MSYNKLDFIIEKSQKLISFLEEKVNNAETTQQKDMYQEMFENFIPLLNDKEFLATFIENFLLEFWKEGENGAFKFDLPRFKKFQLENREEIVRGILENGLDIDDELLQTKIDEHTIPEDVIDELAKYFTMWCDVYTFKE